MNEYRNQWVTTIRPRDGRGKSAWTQRRKPPPAPPVPLQLAGLRLWLRADVLALAEGDPVTTWYDSSGAGRDATQANASLQPTYHAGGFGATSKPYLTFSGGYLSVPVAGLPTGTVDFTVCATVRTSDAGNNRYFLAWGNTSSAGTDLVACGLNLEVLRTTTWGAGLSGTGVVSEGAVHRLSYRLTGGMAAGLYRDGALDTTGAFSYSVGSPSLIIGSVIGSATLPFLGDLAEILLYSPALSNGDQQAIEGYLATKYGV